MQNSIVTVDANLWEAVSRMLLAPIAWIVGMQKWFLEFFLSSSSGWAAAGKLILLLLPVLLFVAAIWCTQLSLCTFLSRPARVKFAGMMVLSWWDAARAVWFYWIGLFQLVVVAIGWCLTLARLALRLAMEALRQLLIAPFTFTGRLSRSYFQPGVPWIAFFMLVFWSLLEATIFTYTLFPTVSEVLADLVGMEAPRLAGPVLYLFLLRQYGTPPLLAFISRQPLPQAEGPAPQPSRPEPVSCWRELIDDFKRETDWLHSKGQEILEYLALPFLHVLAAALNFVMILVASRPVIHLPLKSLKDIMDTREMANSIRLQPKRAEGQ